MTSNIKNIEIENEKLKQLYSAKSDIVSISSHQIRTSLSALKWIIKMFLDGDLGKLTIEQENLMKKAYESNDRALNTVSELLIMNKSENILEKKYVFSKINILELIESTIFDLSGEAHNKKVEIIFLKPEIKIYEVNVDKEKMRIALQNLLDNAIKYSNTDSKVFVTLKKTDDMLQVSVKDTGIIISEESKNKIFKKFYRAPEAENKEMIGSGIGLFTTKKIIEGNGGKIWFESLENDGTTFFFTIPILKNK